MARAAAGPVLAVAASLIGGFACAQGVGAILGIEITRSNPRPVRPGSPVSNLQEMMAAIAACWSPPPFDDTRGPLDLTFQVSFKRSGELFGKPRVIDFARPVTDDERLRYYTAVAEAIDRCSQMPFTEAMGGAVAGRPFRVNLKDRRNSRNTEVIWLTTKTN